MNPLTKKIEEIIRQATGVDASLPGPRNTAQAITKLFEEKMAAWVERVLAELEAERKTGSIGASYTNAGLDIAAKIIRNSKEI